LYDENVRLSGFPPEMPPTLDGLRGLFRQIWAALPDSRVEALRAVEDGGLVAGHLRLTGTHEGELMGAAPTGNRVDVEIMTFLRFGENGKVAERWNLLDSLALLSQLGALPAPAPAPA
jgi:predicted ester cyclase